ncbi:MAG TPA: PLDc N-terminal domain-containing protein [Phycisphaerales bacterium]|jgi:hypothetical protein|nr:PLDc N-terminal domain-containing protein [Phycisphaerales bacterium]
MSIYGIIGLVVLILDIIAAVEILTGSKPALNKLLWLLVIFLLPVIGMILYFLLGRGK